MARVYKATYEDVYKFHAKYGRVPPQNRDDNYWEQLASDVEAYSDDEFTADLLVAVVSELARECRGETQ